MFRRSACALVLCSSFYLPAAAALSQSDAPSTQALVNQLFQLSGLDYQLDTIEPQLLRGIEESITQASPELTERIRVTVEEQFQDQPLHESTLTALRENWHDSHGNTAIDWLRSELGKRVTKREELASSEEGLASLANFRLLADDDPQVRRRKALCQRLKHSIGGTEYAVDTNMAISLAIAYGANAANPVGGRMSQSQVREFVEMSRSMLYRELDTYLDAYFLFTYAVLSEAELQQYVEFMESDAGQWYIGTVKTAYVGSLVNLSMELGARLHKAVNEPASLVEL